MQDMYARASRFSHKPKNGAAGIWPEVNKVESKAILLYEKLMNKATTIAEKSRVGL